MEEEEETGSELVVEMHGELMRKRGSEKLHTDFLFRFKASLSVFKFIFILQSEDKTTRKQKQDLHTHTLSNTHTQSELTCTLTEPSSPGADLQSAVAPSTPSPQSPPPHLLWNTV